MVEQREVDRFSSKRQAAGQLAIRGARRRVAAGVIVGEDQARTAMRGGIIDDIAQRQAGTTDIAVMVRQMDAPRLIIDMRDPQMLFVRVGLGQAIGEEALGRIKASKSQRGFGTLIEHADCIRARVAGSDANRIRCGPAIGPYRM